MRIPINRCNDNEFRQGMLTRIKLKNFVTYDSIEYRLRPKLNYILGPNGTGKSTVLCAVVIGLGGKPSIIGRSPHVADYIKRNCKMAVIELELFNPNGRNHTIKRKITSNTASSWFINGKPVTLAQIDELKQKLNIKIENLCQILPQDRVQDFAKMNKKELLEAIQKSVGNAELQEWFEKLKSNKDVAVNNRRMLDDRKRKLELETQTMNKLEDEVKTYRKRQKVLEEISLVKKKILWTDYDHNKKEAERLHITYQETFDAYKRELENYKPLGRALKEVQEKEKQKITRAETLATAVAHHNQEKKLLHRKAASYAEQYTMAKAEYEQKLEAENSKEEELINIKKQIEDIKNSFPSTSENEIQKELENIEGELLEINKQRSVTRTKQEDFNQRVSRVLQEQKALEYKYNMAKNTHENKLNLLKQNNHLHIAYDWLQQNRHLFKKNIYGPMFMELNVTDPTKAKYVEQVIPHRDLVAFLCEDAKDMSKLLSTLRNQMHLKINALHCEPPNDDIRKLFPPIIPIENLKKYGFTMYLLNLLEGPPAILTYLCKIVNVHNVPVGTEKVEDNLDNIPKQLNVYFSADRRIRSNVSKYSKLVTKDITEIVDARLLSYTVDHELIASLEASLQKLENRRKDLNVGVAQTESTMKNLEVSMNQFKNQKRELNKNREYIKATQVRLRIKEQELKQASENRLDVAEEMNRLKKIRETVWDIRKHTAAIEELDRQQIDLIDEMENLAKIVSEEEKKNIDAKHKVDELKEAAEEKKREMQAKKNEVAGLLDKAKQSTEGFGLDSRQFHEIYAPKFAHLPNDIDQLTSLIEEKEVTVRGIRTMDSRILNEFKTQQELCSKIEREVHNLELRVGNEEQELNELKDKWISNFKELENKINNKFRQYLQFLGCSGSVELDQGNNQDDFANYGLNIKVKFRDEENLKELDPYSQSGGERSLTTAIFLLSLQKIINVPFRFVDEINQGMDSFNEIRVYFLLTCCVDQDETAQYFLITPKLLDGTKISDKVTATIIYSGTGTNLGIRYGNRDEDDDELWDQNLFHTEMNI